MSIDHYERLLLGLAVEVTGANIVIARGVDDGEHDFYIAAAPDHGKKTRSWLTLADSLVALLTDMGVPVPERPTPERAAEAREAYAAAYSFAEDLEFLRALARQEPLTLWALLEDETT